MACKMGNLTLKIEKREDTFSLNNIEVVKYGENAVSLTLPSGDGRAMAKVRFSKEDVKDLIIKLLAVL